MTLVLLTADPHCATGPDREILEQNHAWARQLVSAGRAAERQIQRRVPNLVHGLDARLSAVVRGYEAAVTERGVDSLGILVGHGSGGITSHGTATSPLCDFAPAELCRVTEQRSASSDAGRASVVQLREAIAANPTASAQGVPPSGLRDANLAFWHLSRAIATSPVTDVYLLTCAIASRGPGIDFLSALRRLWGGTIQVHGLQGFLAAADLDCDGRVEMRLLNLAMSAMDGGPPVPLGGGACATSSAHDRFEDRMPDASSFLHARDVGPGQSAVSWHL